MIFVGVLIGKIGSIQRRSRRIPIPAALDSWRIVFDLVAGRGIVKFTQDLAVWFNCRGVLALNRQGGLGGGISGPAMIESNTLSKGFDIPTSTETAFFAANPLLSRSIFDRGQLHGIGDIRVGGHI